MDLIYMNARKEDVGVMFDFTLDLAFGSGENDFECKIVKGNHCCQKNYFLYVENTEYGGIIDSVGVDTGRDEVTYYGRTWHGILNSKIIEPDSGEAYLKLAGEANSVLGLLINRMGLSDLFVASASDSGVNIPNYQMNRYIAGYDGIQKMLKASGAKLHIVFNNGFVELSAKPIVDYSEESNLSTDSIELVVKKNYNPLNHVICLGKGELEEREVIHVYADKYGNICEEQSLTGLQEVVEVYENVNAESSEELRQGGIERIAEAWKSTETDFDFNSDEESFDVGDIISANDEITGITAVTEIAKKIVKISNNTVTVSYVCGEIVTGGNNAESAILGEAILGSLILGG